MKGLLNTTFLAGPLQKADISFTMEEGGRPFLSHQEKLPLIPASNMKLVISAAALLIDNGNELFPPLLSYADGQVSEGVLKGNLVIDSCGSLIFSARFPADETFEKKNELLKKQVESYAQQLRQAGINEISGDLILSFKRWNASGENKHYTAAAAFSYHENTVDTQVSQGKMFTAPQSPLVFSFSENNTVEDQDKVENNLIRFNPAVDSRDYWRISKHSATSYALSMLKRELQNCGIKLNGNKTPKNETLHKLFETSSLYKTPGFIHPLNKHSDNFRAELLALLINWKSTGKAEYLNLDKTIKDILKSHSLVFRGLSVNDGSGLSRKNKIAARDLNTLLKFMQKQKSFESYFNSLSIAAKSGTLKNRFKGTPWEGTFHGKTGTLDGVSSLSGYWLRKDKPVVTFSFIGNGAENSVFWEALEKFAASLRFMI